MIFVNKYNYKCKIIDPGFELSHQFPTYRCNGKFIKSVIILEYRITAVHAQCSHVMCVMYPFSSYDNFLNKSPLRVSNCKISVNFFDLI